MTRFLCCLMVVFMWMGLVGAQDEAITLTLVTHDSFSVSEEVLSQFEAETGIVGPIMNVWDPVPWNIWNMPKSEPCSHSFCFYLTDCSR